MRRILVSLLAIPFLAAAVAPQAAMAVTDEEVVKSIEKARDFLIGLQQPNGSWPEQRQPEATSDYGNSETVMFTLIYIGVHPNREVISKGLDALISRPLDYTYAVSMRTMALALVQNKLAGAKRDLIRQALKADVQFLITAQGSHGGWNYKSLNGSGGRYDFSNTQLAILALREAALAGVEIPDFVWQRAQKLYFERQQTDGGWNYGDPGNAGMGASVPSYGSMTAAGLASVFITADNLDVNSGCPCRGTVSNKTRGGDLDRKVDAALSWLSREFKPDVNPKFPGDAGSFKLYWLYAVERVGIAAGYKYFGTHHWYREGAEHLLRSQQDNGAWGNNMPDTCFATLFLFKGRAPVLYNKLMFNTAGKEGEWRNHRRDIANLTSYIERTKEQMFHWQIVSLQAPVDELHDAPILYITAESIPEFSDTDLKKLREFTDTGGTILFEASCGNPAVRRWFSEFVKKVWPEFGVPKPLGPDHGVFSDPNPLKQRPEIMGLDDGLRTFLFYAPEDISCHWQTRAVAGREYLFKWGINLFTYAMDHAQLRPKLASREVQPTRFTSPVKAGDKATVRIARLKYEGNWAVGRAYKGLQQIAADVQKKANITLQAEETGVAAADLGDRSAAYLCGAGAFAMAPAESQALKAWLAKGGFLWVEAANGSAAFDAAFRKFAQDMGWTLTPMPKEAPLMTGAFTKGVAYNLTQKVEFSRALRVQRMGRAFAELVGIYQDGKLVGVYSPFDVVFSTTGYEAYNRRGYTQEDALAVADNIIVYLTDRTGAE